MASFRYHDFLRDPEGDDEDKFQYLKDYQNYISDKFKNNKHGLSVWAYPSHNTFEVNIEPKLSQYPRPKEFEGMGDERVVNGSCFSSVSDRHPYSDVYKVLDDLRKADESGDLKKTLDFIDKRYGFDSKEYDPSPSYNPSGMKIYEDNGKLQSHEYFSRQFDWYKKAKRDFLKSLKN